MGFQPSKTLKLASNPFPQPRAWLPAHPRTLLLPKPNRQVPTSRTQNWPVSSREAQTGSCGVRQRTPLSVCATLTVVILGGPVICRVRQRSESLVWTEICPCELQVQVGAMSENEVARSKTRVAVRPHQSAAPGQGRHACLPLPWPPPGEMIRRPLWPPGWDR